MDIFTVCKDGFYDANCSTKCGQCEENEICDKTYGYCLRGCKQNFQPPFCTGIIWVWIFFLFKVKPCTGKITTFENALENV